MDAASYCYCVWYLDSTVNKEAVAGMCHNWNEANKMAKDLYAIRKKIDKANNVSRGIFLFYSGDLHTSTIPKRWQIMPLLTSNSSS